MKNKKRLLAIPLVLALFGLSAASCRDMAVTNCLENPDRPPIITAPPNGTSWPGANVLANNSPIDIRHRSNDHNTSTDDVGMAFEMPAGGGRDGLCIVGGYFYTSHDEVTTPWSSVWHKRYGLVVDTPNALVIGTTLRNTGDGISIRKNTATNFTIVGVQADGGTEYPEGAFIHDDCVENDTFQAGKIVDSKFDGCHSFLSSQVDPGGTSRTDGGARTIEVSNTLVRLQPMHNSYNVGQYGYDKHGGFFKFSRADVGDAVGDGTPPQLSIHDSIFRSDEAAPYGTQDLHGALGLPEHTTCHDVTIVGWETWPPAQLARWESLCTNLVKGTVADWDAAVASWDSTHPALYP